MKQLNLPKGYLSASAMKLWRKSKTQFRQRYYEAKPLFETKYMRFGKTVGTFMETGDASLVDLQTFESLIDFKNQLPEGKYEQKFEIEVGGVPMLGFFDLMSKDEFDEFKTGKKEHNAEIHFEQLITYWIAFKSINGKYPKRAFLDWFETDENPKLYCTGKIQREEVKFTSKQIKAFEAEVQSVALEISDDYTKWENGETTELVNIQAYVDYAKQIKAIEAKAKEAKELLKEELVTKGLTEYSDDSISIFYTTRKTKTFDDETKENIDALKAQIKELESNPTEVIEKKSLVIKLK